MLDRVPSVVQRALLGVQLIPLRPERHQLSECFYWCVKDVDDLFAVDTLEVVRYDQRGERRNERGIGRGRSVDRRADERRDPLGRQLREGTSGTDEGSDVEVPGKGQMEEARTRAIQEELRRRGADRGRPQQELEYIDRLLRQF